MKQGGQSHGLLLGPCWKVFFARRLVDFFCRAVLRALFVRMLLLIVTTLSASPARLGLLVAVTTSTTAAAATELAELLLDARLSL